MSKRMVNEVDRCQVTDTIYRYFWLVDHGHADQIPDLFTPVGRLTFGDRAPMSGTLTATEIAAAMVARSKQSHVTTRHVVSNIMLRSRDEETIEAYSLLTLYRSEDLSRDSYPTSIADVEDVFLRVRGGWQIAQRTISPVFNRP